MAFDSNAWIVALARLAILPLLGGSLALSGCGGASGGSSSASIVTPTPTPTPTPSPTPTPTAVTSVTSSVVATFATPWAFAFLPDSRIIVTERSLPGRMWLVTEAGSVSAISGLPANVGILDVVVDPRLVTNRQLLFTFMEEDRTAPRFGRNSADLTTQPQGIALARATLTIDSNNVGQLS